MKVEAFKYVIWAAEMDRCVNFYKEVFGVEVSMQSEGWSELLLLGGRIGIHGGGEGKRTWTGLSFQVSDVEAGMTMVKEAGGEVSRGPDDPENDPVLVAMCVDPEGNEFMMTQRVASYS